MSANDNNERARVVDAEIVDGPDNGRANPGRAFYGYGNGINRLRINSYYSDSGCLAALVTFFVFCACLGQFGLLAAIGFFFFHTIGSIMGTFRASSRLVAGLPWSPWPWRCGNWLVSFLLTAWLAGGFSS